MKLEPALVSKTSVYWCIALIERLASAYNLKLQRASTYIDSSLSFLLLSSITADGVFQKQFLKHLERSCRQPLGLWHGGSWNGISVQVKDVCVLHFLQALVLPFLGVVDFRLPLLCSFNLHE